MGERRDEHRETPDGEYTRFKAKIQRGDGIDRRGDVEVEVVRERSEVRVDLDEIEHEIADDVSVTTLADHGPFAEFSFELERAVRLLEDQLGLDGE